MPTRVTGRRKKGKQEAGNISQDCGMHINELQIDILQKVFSVLKQQERLQTIPLVCKAWHRAASMPSLMWERLKVTEVVCGLDGKSRQGDVDCDLLRPWLQQRAPSVHGLYITVVTEGPDPLERILETTLPLLPALQDMRLFAVGRMSGDQLALLASLLQPCTSLRELMISFAPDPAFKAQDLDCFGGLHKLDVLSVDMHARPNKDEGTAGALMPWRGGFPGGLCCLTHLTELEISLRGFNRPRVVLPEEFARMGALKRLRLDSCGALEVRREAAALQQLSSVSLRQCRLEAIGCLNNLLSLPALDELRIEDCTSEEAGLELPWEETMRLMPPLLELMDMFNIVCRRCKSNLVDTDLLKAAARLQRMLLARCNQLAALPPLLGASRHCLPGRLSLRYCGLQHLPPGRYLASLKVLDLEGNSFRCIPPALAAATSLTHLDLSCNQDLQVGPADVDALKRMSSLSILDVSKVSERLPREGGPTPDEVLPYWTSSSLHHLASFVCAQHDKPGHDVEVGVLLLGAPWLSKAFVKLRGDGSCDVCATCDAYIAQLQSIMLPLTRQAAQAARSERRRQQWRGFVWQSFCVGIGAVFERLSRRLRWPGA